MVGTALKCGKGTHISEYVAEILKIADADGGCSCDDGTPQLVTGLGVSGDEVIVVAGTGMTVTSVDGGNTITYTVSLSSSNEVILANTTNSIVTAGNNTSVSTTSSMAYGVQTYTYEVSAIDTVVESSFARVLIDVGDTLLPIMTIENQKQYGSLFSALNQNGTGSDFVTNQKNSNFQEWRNTVTDFKVANFSPGSLETYFPEVHFSRIDFENVKDPGVVIDPTLARYDISVDLIEVKNGYFRFRFSDPAGLPVTGGYIMDRFSKIELIFKIQG
jgi:hypothetical protein